MNSTLNDLTNLPRFRLCDIIPYINKSENLLKQDTQPYREKRLLKSVLVAFSQ